MRDGMDHDPLPAGCGGGERAGRLCIDRRLAVEQRGLVDVEKVPSEKGPPRKVYTLNAQGAAQLDEFWETWRLLTERLDRLRPAPHGTRTDHKEN